MLTPLSSSDVSFKYPRGPFSGVLCPHTGNLWFCDADDVRVIPQSLLRSDADAKQTSMITDVGSSFPEEFAGGVVYWAQSPVDPTIVAAIVAVESERDGEEEEGEGDDEGFVSEETIVTILRLSSDKKAATGGSFVEVARSSMDDGAQQLVWSPDGRFLAVEIVGETDDGEQHSVELFSYNPAAAASSKKKNVLDTIVEDKFKTYPTFLTTAGRNKSSLSPVLEHDDGEAKQWLAVINTEKDAIELWSSDDPDAESPEYTYPLQDLLPELINDDEGFDGIPVEHMVGYGRYLFVLDQNLQLHTLVVELSGGPSSPKLAKGKGKKKAPQMTLKKVDFAADFFSEAKEADLPDRSPLLFLTPLREQFAADGDHRVLLAISSNCSSKVRLLQVTLLPSAPAVKCLVAVDCEKDTLSRGLLASAGTLINVAEVLGAEEEANIPLTTCTISLLQCNVEGAIGAAPRSPSRVSFGPTQTFPAPPTADASEPSRKSESLEASKPHPTGFRSVFETTPPPAPASAATFPAPPAASSANPFALATPGPAAVPFPPPNSGSGKSVFASQPATSPPANPFASAGSNPFGGSSSFTSAFKSAPDAATNPPPKDGSKSQGAAPFPSATTFGSQSTPGFPAAPSGGFSTAFAPSAPSVFATASSGTPSPSSGNPFATPSNSAPFGTQSGGGSFKSAFSAAPSEKKGEQPSATSSPSGGSKSQGASAFPAAPSFASAESGTGSWVKSAVSAPMEKKGEQPKATSSPSGDSKSQGGNAFPATLSFAPPKASADATPSSLGAATGAPKPVSASSTSSNDATATEKPRASTFSPPTGGSVFAKAAPVLSSTEFGVFSAPVPPLVVNPFGTVAANPLGEAPKAPSGASIFAKAAPAPPSSEFASPVPPVAANPFGKAAANPFGEAPKVTTQVGGFKSAFEAPTPSVVEKTSATNVGAAKSSGTLPAASVPHATPSPSLSPAGSAAKSSPGRDKGGAPGDGAKEATVQHTVPVSAPVATVANPFIANSTANSFKAAFALTPGPAATGFPAVSTVDVKPLPAGNSPSIPLASFTSQPFAAAANPPKNLDWSKAPPVGGDNKTAPLLPAADVLKPLPATGFAIPASIAAPAVSGFTLPLAKPEEPAPSFLVPTANAGSPAPQGSPAKPFVLPGFHAASAIAKSTSGPRKFEGPNLTLTLDTDGQAKLVEVLPQGGHDNLEGKASLTESNGELVGKIVWTRNFGSRKVEGRPDRTWELGGFEEAALLMIRHHTASLERAPAKVVSLSEASA